MKSQYWIILVVIVLLIGIGIGTLFTPKPPTFTVKGAEINSVNLSAIGLSFIIDVDSSYPVAIPIKSLAYTVSYQGRDGPIELASGEKKGIMIKPGKDELVIPVLISNPSIVKAAFEVLRTGEIRLIINGNATPDFFGVAPAVPFSKEVAIPVKLGDISGDIISSVGSLAGSLLSTK
jgi:LEA14-like dessication related protein